MKILKMVFLISLSCVGYTFILRTHCMRTILPFQFQSAWQNEAALFPPISGLRTTVHAAAVEQKIYSKTKTKGVV
jgi:hypothetical protein